MKIHNNAFLRYNIPHIYIKTQCYNFKQLENVCYPQQYNIRGREEQLNLSFLLTVKVQGHGIPMQDSLLFTSEAGGWKSHFCASLFSASHLWNYPSLRKYPALQTFERFTRLMIWNLEYWRKRTDIFLKLDNYHASQDRSRIVGWGTQCLWGELRLIKRWQKDNYQFSGGWETSPMFHVPYLNWEPAQITSTSAFGTGLATENPQLLRPQEHSLLPAGLNVVIYNNTDHLWRQCVPCSTQNYISSLILKWMGCRVWAAEVIVDRLQAEL